MFSLNKLNQINIFALHQKESCSQEIFWTNVQRFIIVMIVAMFWEGVSPVAQLQKHAVLNLVGEQWLSHGSKLMKTGSVQPAGACPKQQVPAHPACVWSQMVFNKTGWIRLAC